MNEHNPGGLSEHRREPPFRNAPSSLRSLAGFAVAIALAVLLAGIVVVTNADFLVGGVFIGVLGVLVITLYSVEYGFYIFVFAVLLFDQFWIPGFPTVTMEAGYFLNFSTISYLPANTIAVTPMEIHLLFVVAVGFLAGLHERRPFIRVEPLGPYVAFFAAVLSSTGLGLVRGGNMVIALWEVRGLAYLAVMMALVPQIIRTKEQVERLLIFCVLGITVKALQGSIRYAGLGFSFGQWPEIYQTLTNHEDPVFMVTCFFLLAALVTFGAGSSLKRLLKYVAPVLWLGFVAAQRRAAYASAAASGITFLALLPSETRRKTLKAAVVPAILFVIYLAVFWNSTSSLGSIAQQVKATVTEQPGMRGKLDVESKQARDVENYNLAYTFRAEPFLGRGFGMPFYMPLRLWSLVARLGEYIPHNQILWVFVKMGIVGGFLFWLFMSNYVLLASRVYRNLQDPFLRSVGILCVIAVVNQLVVSYVDMQLTWYRNMVYLGVLMGLVPVLPRVEPGRHATSSA